MRCPRDNPFNSRSVARLRYRMGDAARASLLERAQAAGGGLLVGPHGSGKTTLLEDLQLDCERAGLPVRSIRLNADERRPVQELLRWARDNEPGTVLLFDSAGCLAPWTLWRWRRAARACCTILTVHGRHPGAWGLPVLHRHRVDEDLAEACLRQLLGESFEPSWLPRLLAAYHQCRGNIREVWLQLYDDWQAGPT